MAAHAKQAIESYVVLAGSRSGAAAGKNLIMSAVNDRHTYVFGELFDLPIVTSIGEEPEYNLLNLFAFGTYMEYSEDPSRYPELSPSNLHKLKKLTIVSLGSQNKTLQYENLMQTLEIGTTRDLEDMLIECMYEELITGKLDQRLGSFEVTSVMTRDVKREALPGIIQKLERWVDHSETILGTLQQLGAHADDQFDAATEAKKTFDEAVEQMERHVKQFTVEDDAAPRRRQRFPN